MLRHRRAVHEVPRLQLPLLAVEDDDALPETTRKVLLGSTHRGTCRSAGRLEHGDAEADLGELRSPLEHGSLAERVASPPEDIARIDHEPALALGKSPTSVSFSCASGTPLTAATPPGTPTGLRPETGVGLIGFDVSSDTLASCFAATSSTA